MGADRLVAMALGGVEAGRRLEPLPFGVHECHECDRCIGDPASLLDEAVEALLPWRVEHAETVQGGSRRSSSGAPGGQPPACPPKHGGAELRAHVGDRRGQHEPVGDGGGGERRNGPPGDAEHADAASDRPGRAVVVDVERRPRRRRGRRRAAPRRAPRRWRPLGPPLRGWGRSSPQRRWTARSLEGGHGRGRRRRPLALEGRSRRGPRSRLPSAAASTSSVIPPAATSARARASRSSTASSSRWGSWWNSTSRRAPAVPAMLDGVLHRAVAPADLGGVAGGVVLRVVHHDVGIGEEVGVAGVGAAGRRPAAGGESGIVGLVVGGVDEPWRRRPRCG